MEEKDRIVLKKKITKIYDDFNKILKKEGLGNLQVRNFRVTADNLENCKDIREVVRKDGSTYLKCFDN